MPDKLTKPEGPVRQSINKILSAFGNLTSRPMFTEVYAGLAVLILLGSTLLWTILSARVQSSNADQLVNTYLFTHPSALASAIFPSAHTMLIKWPLFGLIKIFGMSSSTLVIFTVLTVLLTVGLLAAILYRLERRLLIFGTLCLALASCLLLVPTQPHTGGLLPVNMAMLATRNLEYIIYIVCVFLFARSPRLHSWRFWLAVGLMALLVASDKLFLVLGLGGALLALVVYALSSGWNLVSLTVRWLVGGLAAGICALAILWWLNWAGLTHIAAGSSVGPYGLAHSLHDVALGAIYGILGLLTNFGANPAFNTSVLRDVPHDIATQLVGISGLSFIVNLVILLAGLYSAWRLVGASLAHNKDSEVELGYSARLAIMLIWTALAAFLVFALSNHYYAADARYLAVALFAVFISLASFGSRREWRPEIVFSAGLIISLGMLLAIPTVVKAYNDDQAAVSPNNQRNALISTVLSHHSVDVLVGDYWRVIPTKLASGGKLNVMPLQSCTDPRTALTSKAWQYDLTKHSFAYLLTLDGSSTDYPDCSLDQIVKAYGRPNASVLIAGSLSNPKEQLLFYDHGIRKSSPITTTNPPGTVLPITLDQLPHTYCTVPTDMNIVAHEDDDLLFMSPDVLHDIKDGHCVRTVYITAGDAGHDQFYWLGREQGSEAAYSAMLGTDDIWIERIVKLAENQYITVANPRGDANVSLIFMHLPDGNLNGQGFPSSHFQSLAKLESGAITQFQSVDGQSVYTSAQLTDALTMLMHAYQPAEIRTQANYVSQKYPDHSDHMAVGRDVKQAYVQYEIQQYENQVTIPLKFYIGYPIHERPANVTGDDLTQKELTFVAYSKFDGGVCQSLQRCLADPAYGAYLVRQYQNDY
ncbi:MAG TPA: PIG-L family deacetylase [Candidatus Binatia bacterium]|nr:PIG-L family deacetylase [Candidatus Binatia bacterium]